MKGQLMKPPAKRKYERYFWRDMAIDDYVRVKAEDIQKARVAASKYKERNPGWNYVSKKHGDSHFLIWRIA